MKKILFVNPSLRLHSKTKYLPVGLASVMTYLSHNGIEADLLDVDIHALEDDQVESYLEKNKYDIFLSGSIVTHYKWMKWLCRTIKKHNPNSTVIIGNSVGGSVPELFLNNSPADIVVKGEGEITTFEIVNKLLLGQDWRSIEGIFYKDTDGKVVGNSPRKGKKKLDEFPLIDWSKFDTEAYFKKNYADAKGLEGKEIRAMPVVTARGCAFRCTFCHFVFWNDPYRYRSPQNILTEVKRNIDFYNCNYISFWDDLSFASLPQAERFADAIIEAGLEFNWSAAVRVDLFGNPKHEFKRRLNVAKKFKQAGCVSLGFSLESANQQILEMMNKRIKAEYFLEQVKILNEVGITSMISVVFGYPIETAATINETFEMCREAKIYPSMGYLLPLPDTEMYEYALKHQFIIDENQYLDAITERQDLCINMTKLGEQEVRELIAEGAEKLNAELGIGLNADSLIKTGGYNKHTNKKRIKKFKREDNSLILNYSEAEFIQS